MKLYMQPPVWIWFGFVTGWAYFRPGLISGITYAIVVIGMAAWIMSDLKHHEINPK